MANQAGLAGMPNPLVPMNGFWILPRSGIGCRRRGGLRRLGLVLGVGAGCALAPPHLRAATTWTQDSFQDFRGGSFLDGGSNLYVSARGRIQIINRWDLNNDGFVDLVVPAGHAHTEKENTYIYLNHGGDVDGRTRIEIPGGGSAGGLIADLNHDGLNDLIVANSNDSHVEKVDTWIYWGTPGGYSAEHRTKLPAYDARAVVVGDFNGDGWPDLAIACQWQDGADPKANRRPVSLIYWNSPQGFDPAHRLELPLDGEVALSMAVGDLDGDGRTDLVVQTAKRTHIFKSTEGAFASGIAQEYLPVPGTVVAVGDFDGDGTRSLAIGRRGSVTIVKSHAGRFQAEGAQVLEVSDPHALCAVDVNRDGADDLVVANYSSPGGATWTDSVVFYSDHGHFDPAKATPLHTLGATGVSAGDLNGDGYPELVFSNACVTNERSLLSYVFWNDRGTFRFDNHTELPTAGSVGNALGDVNNDGQPDIVFFNNDGGFTDGPAETNVYWGDGTRHFSPERRTTISTHHVFGIGNADLDDDGYVDLILTRDTFLEGVPNQQTGLTIYWSGPTGFGPPTEITAESAYGGVRVADLNKDGYLDIVSGGVNDDPNDPARRGIPIYWGSATGFRRQNRTVIPTKGERIRGPLVADLNRDGWLDIAAQETPGTITIWWGSPAGYENPRKTVIDLGRPDALMYLQAADFNRDGWLDLLLPQRGPPDGTEVSSLILYGSPSGFSREHSAVLPCYVTYQNTIADLDRDGWLDIVLCSYGGEVRGNRPSLIYWGGPKGFLARPRTELPTNGSSGTLALDFDGDGWLDLFFANHRQAGSIDIPLPHRHTNPSMLYWGGPDGFSPSRRWEVMAQGPSGLNLRDPGNTYDRGLYEDFTSSAFNIPGEEQLASIDWTAETPFGTKVQFQVRTADTKADLDKSTWIGPQGQDSWWTKPQSISKQPSGRWIQYRARLQTPNGGPTPYLSRVALTFE